MTQRQKAQLIIVLVGIQHLFPRGQLEQNIAVTDHGALGGARGAGGVDQHANIVGLALGNAGAELFFRIGNLFAQRVQLIQKHDHGIAEIAQALAVIDDNLFQRRDLITHRQVLVQLLVVFHEQEGRATVVNQVRQLFGTVGGIDPVTDAPCPGNAEVAVQPFFVVFAEDGNRLSALQPKGQQRHTNGTGFLVVIEPAVALPDAQFLFAMGDGIAPLQALLTPEFDHGVATVELSG